MPTTAQVPGLAHWGDLSPRVAKLTQAHPNLASRLICAPVRATHCYSIFIQRSDIVDDEHLASTLFGNHPRDLLDIVWPDRTPELFTMLERIAGPVWKIERYLRLERLLKSRIGDSMLSVLSVNEHTILFYEELKKLDVLVANAVNALERNINMVKALGAVITILRKMDVLAHDEVEAASLKQVRVGGIGKWLERRLRRAMAPTIPFPPSLRQITTCTEMVALGRELKNCLGDVRTLIALVTGELVFLRMDDDLGPIVVCLARGPAGCWMIHEAQGSADRWEDTLSEGVQAVLRNAGLDIIPTTIKGAFLRFSWP